MCQGKGGLDSLRALRRRANARATPPMAEGCPVEEGVWEMEGCPGGGGRGCHCGFWAEAAECGCRVMGSLRFTGSGGDKLLRGPPSCSVPVRMASAESWTLLAPLCVVSSLCPRGHGSILAGWVIAFYPRDPLVWSEALDLPPLPPARQCPTLGCFCP